MARGRTYTADEKAHAVVQAEATTGGTREAAKTLGIPQRTLQNWVEVARQAGPLNGSGGPEFNAHIATRNADILLYIGQKRLETASELSERLPTIAGLLMDNLERLLRQGDIKGSELQACTTSFAIKVDKIEHLLNRLSGQGRYGAPAESVDATAQQRVLDTLNSTPTLSP